MNNPKKEGKGGTRSPNSPSRDVNEVFTCQVKCEVIILLIQQNVCYSFILCVCDSLAAVIGPASVSSAFVLQITWSWDGIINGRWCWHTEVHLSGTTKGLWNSCRNFASSLLSS